MVILLWFYRRNRFVCMHSFSSLNESYWIFFSFLHRIVDERRFSFEIIAAAAAAAARTSSMTLWVQCGHCEAFRSSTIRNKWEIDGQTPIVNWAELIGGTSANAIYASNSKVSRTFPWNWLRRRHRSAIRKYVTVFKSIGEFPVSLFADVYRVTLSHVGSSHLVNIYLCIVDLPLVCELVFKPKRSVFLICWRFEFKRV